MLVKTIKEINALQIRVSGDLQVFDMKHLSEYLLTRLRRGMRFSILVLHEGQTLLPASALPDVVDLCRNAAMIADAKKCDLDDLIYGLAFVSSRQEIDLSGKASNVYLPDFPIASFDDKYLAIQYLKTVQEAAQ